MGSIYKYCGVVIIVLLYTTLVTGQQYRLSLSIDNNILAINYLDNFQSESYYYETLYGFPIALNREILKPPSFTLSKRINEKLQLQLQYLSIVRRSYAVTDISTLAIVLERDIIKKKFGSIGFKYGFGYDFGYLIAVNSLNFLSYQVSYWSGVMGFDFEINLGKRFYLSTTVTQFTKIRTQYLLRRLNIEHSANFGFGLGYRFGVFPTNKS